MNINVYISSLVKYGLNKGLFEACDRTFIINSLIAVLELDGYTYEEPQELPLEDILKGLLDYAVERGICEDNIVSRDLFDTKLMGIMTPMPREVRKRFEELYKEDSQKATDWFYTFSQDTDYIRRYRISKDMRWKTATEYGELDITINLSKPEKDPKAIAAAKNAPQSDYPKCMLCMENEGYAGRINHPARQNHRIIPITIANSDWYMQYSPYVYYNEHCIVFNGEHTPFDFSTKEKLGERFASEHEQIKVFDGFDHNFALDGYGYRLAAKLTGDKSGITMEMFTDQSAVQLYTGNMIDEYRLCKDGSKYPKHAALCLETQAFPNFMKYSHFPNGRLKKGEKYDKRTVYRFMK